MTTNTIFCHLASVPSTIVRKWPLLVHSHYLYISPLQGSLRSSYPRIFGLPLNLCVIMIILMYMFQIKLMTKIMMLVLLPSSNLFLMIRIIMMVVL